MPGFFDLERRFSLLDQDGPLAKLNALVPWEEFRSTLETINDKERKSKSGLVEKLFAQFNGFLTNNGFAAKKGQIVDASIVSAPRQRNSREESALIKGGRQARGLERCEGALTWQQVDLTHKTMFLGQTKNGDPLLVPLVDEAFWTFKALHKSKSSCPFVFHMEGKRLLPEQISQAFIRTCKKAGITYFRFHDLRHDFATRLVKKGVELYRVGKLLAHRTVTMTKRYAHLDIDDLRDAVGVLSGGSGYKALPVLNSRKVGPAEPSTARV